jgi:hypothetical protein
MGTRGFISFAVDGEVKTAYNHWDSYPDGLGLTVLHWLRNITEQGTITGAREAAAALRVVSPDSKPAPEDIERLSRYSWNAAQHGGTQDLRDGQQWYDLLHETQGNPDRILEAGVVEDASEFPADSLFAEWGYVIDFDNDGRLEVYEGFQKAAHSKGRFAGLASANDGYYPVALVASWPLAELPDDAAFVAALEGGDDE